jgi:predicted RNA-binding protein associated with RNAse of E/G family
MDDINDILKSVINSLSNKSLSLDQKISDDWISILEAKEKEHSKFLSVKNDQIFVAVDSNAWLYHFRSNQKKLLKKMKSFHPNIKNIIFKLGLST